MDWEYHRKKFYRDVVSAELRFPIDSSQDDVISLMEYWQENLGGYGYPYYRYGVPDDDGR